MSLDTINQTVYTLDQKIHSLRSKADREKLSATQIQREIDRLQRDEKSIVRKMRFMDRLSPISRSLAHEEEVRFRRNKEKKLQEARDLERQAQEDQRQMTEAEHVMAELQKLQGTIKELETKATTWISQADRIHM